MIKFAPILLALIYGYIMYRFSVWRTKSNLDKNSTLLADKPIKALTDKMAKSLDLPEIKVNIYEIEAVNGLAAPDGRIFITRGFLKKYYNKEVTASELVSVIAHELGHVALGHSRKRMIDFSGQNAMRVALMMILNRFKPGVGALVANFLTSLLAAKLSRKDEYEADAYASALLTKSDIGIKGQKDLLIKLEKISSGVGNMPAWLLSHPKTKNRIDAIEILEKAWQK
jgi:putative metalloprotease